MKDKNLLKRVICGIMIGCMTLTSGIFAFAGENIAKEEDFNSAVIQRTDNPQNYMEDALKKLVQEGKITKEKADIILEYKGKKRQEYNKLTEEQKQQIKKSWEKKGFLRQMEEEGIITKAEAEAIRTKLREMRETRITDALNSLVEKGVISKDDVSNIESYLTKVRDERKAEYEKVRNMTESERKEYYKSKKADKKDIITRMVEEKIITEKQAEELQKVLPELGRQRARGRR